VRGAPFAGVHPRRYGWSDQLRVEMCLRIAAVAREVAHRTVMSDRSVSVWAAAIGLQVMPGRWGGVVVDLHDYGLERVVAVWHDWGVASPLR
jgi:hypothetical protein